MISTFNQISGWLDDKRTPRLEGWATVEKAHALAATVFAIRPKVCVEIGVYAGRSLLPVALALKEIGGGVALGVDPWHPECSAEGYDKENAKWWREVANHKYAYDQLMDWRAQTKTAPIVQVIRFKSDDFDPPPCIDLLHIDGQHSEQARRDVARYASKVRVGGIVFMDDIGWANNGVQHVKLATDDLVNLGFVKLFGIHSTGNDCEIFQRVK